MGVGALLGNFKCGDGTSHTAKKTSEKRTCEPGGCLVREPRDRETSRYQRCVAEGCPQVQVSRMDDLRNELGRSGRKWGPAETQRSELELGSTF